MIAMDASELLRLLVSCAPLVDPGTAMALVAVESSFNPHAIGVVGGMLTRQPRDRHEALATALGLTRDRFDYSVGLAQINVRNFQRLGLTLDSAFEPCRNLQAMQIVLIECQDRALGQGAETQRALRQALSCYYSGNFTSGITAGYVGRVVRTARTTHRSITHRAQEALQ